MIHVSRIHEIPYSPVPHTGLQTDLLNNQVVDNLSGLTVGEISHLHARAVSLDVTLPELLAALRRPRDPLSECFTTPPLLRQTVTLAACGGSRGLI